MRCELILGINLLVTFAARSFRGISVPFKDKLSAGKVVAMISAISWSILLYNVCTFCDFSHVFRVLRCDSRGLYVIQSACFDIASLSSLFWKKVNHSIFLKLTQAFSMREFNSHQWCQHHPWLLSSLMLNA